ncbi:hypothetical protein AX16_004574 [Volvariella volvacea WC 439]|nr:hypothetical protein AX16_004574 [Volvariella volvacea WC 439]
MDIQRPQPTYKPATTVQPGAVSEMKVMRAPEGQSRQVEPQEGKAARIRGGGAAKVSSFILTMWAILEADLNRSVSTGLPHYCTCMLYMLRMLRG